MAEGAKQRSGAVEAQLKGPAAREKSAPSVSAYLGWATAMGQEAPGARAPGEGVVAEIAYR